jgi:hypothetical protein
MGINLKNAVVCTAVGAVVSGLLATNLNAITAAATYSTANLSAITSASASVNADTSSTTSTISSTTTSTFTSLDVWINKLAEAESGNRARIKILDVNGRYSYGCLQFQMATFKAYSTRYGLVDPDAITSWDEQIYNCQLQKQIAKRMIQEKPSNWRHWGYTVLHKGTGLPPEKETIVGELAFAQ